MSKYKIGDKVLVEGEIGEGMGGIYRVHIGNQCVVYAGEDTMKDASKTYEDGLADAWKLARKVSHMCLDDMNKCFDLEDLDKYGAYMMLYDHFTPQEALAKIEAYEKSQQIQVGDVVKSKDSELEFIVTAINGISVQGVARNGDVYNTERKHIEQTGRHIDISSILEQIRGNE